VLSPQNIVSEADALACIRLMRSQKVGGSFWGTRPDLPAGLQLLLAPRDSEQAAEMIASAAARFNRPAIAILTPDDIQLPVLQTEKLIQIASMSDPWHLIDRFTEIWVDADSDFALLSKIAGKNVVCWGSGFFDSLDSKIATSDTHLVKFLRNRYFVSGGPMNPFTAQPMTLVETVGLLSFWKELIEANRDINFAAGFAFWKRPTVEPLLWSGQRDVPFMDDLSTANENSVAAVWTSRISAKTKKQIVSNRPKIIEVEDGFVRSTGLGANCVPPLSIIADRRGIYFDPSQESDLEHILQNAIIDEAMQLKADALRQAIVAAAISKYGKIGQDSEAAEQISEQSQGRKIILVPGQVEDDRSVQSGGGNITGNLQLLAHTRACEPDAYIIYKPHPDVEAGHRRGALDDAAVSGFANIIVRDGDIIQLVELADHIHVLTSLTGFEALLRGKPVTTHGVPFYAGWGLTEDKGNIPARRTTRRNLAELVAATLIIYARYLDPVTNLPCPADILIKRLEEGLAMPKTALMLFREFQGFIRLTINKGTRWLGI
jgi:capsular polysaccharide export protein